MHLKLFIKLFKLFIKESQVISKNRIIINCVEKIKEVFEVSLRSTGFFNRFEQMHIAFFQIKTKKKARFPPLV